MKGHLQKGEGSSKYLLYNIASRSSSKSQIPQCSIVVVKHDFPMHLNNYILVVGLSRDFAIIDLFLYLLFIQRGNIKDYHGPSLHWRLI